VAHFKLEPVDETFFDTAPRRYVETFEIGLPATDVWAELVADGAVILSLAARCEVDLAAAIRSRDNAVADVACRRVSGHHRSHRRRKSRST